MSRRKESSARGCHVDGCSKATFKRGYCADHYRATYGDGASSSSSASTKAGAASLFSAATVGCEDMIMLSNASEKTITENLQVRHAKNLIYTYIGHVLISVNPFQQIKGLYSPETIKLYHGKETHANPPHIYALTENAYKTMRYEEESQCVIVSGESGAGKTEAAKAVMTYISAVSGGGAGADTIKQAILASNPLLEALGNAKTLRNDNSSRFGKYFAIQFDAGGVPRSGYITNYLLEKSRVVFQNKGERNFHIFYQLCRGAPAAAMEKYSLGSGVSDFVYLSASGSPDVPGIDDVADFEETRKALKATGFGSKEQDAIFSLIAAVLHIGNLKFKEDEKTGSCKISSTATAAEMLGIDTDTLKRIITVRHIKTAKEEYDVPNNAVQCVQARDAIAKALYYRLFDWVVKRVNQAIANEDAQTEHSIGVLDIYGFEVFAVNGFEQFCINFCNEKLQQIFIELTLKSEQEEYAREGIAWQPIPFFNNRVVCELIEGSLSNAIRLPPGIFSLLDDVCATMHAESKGADSAFANKVLSIHGSHPHCASAGSKIGFIVKHYAGDVEYRALDFPEKNADSLGNDIILSLQASTKKLIPILFPEVVDLDSKKKPQTAGHKIRQQTKELVAALMASNPHYIRTIKSNDVKKPAYMDVPRVLFQVRYLGMLEALRVRRAGFAYRREFHDFVKRFAILSKKTWPNEYSGSDKDACKAILSSIKKLKPDLATKEQIQLGKTMLFIKDPETLNEFDQLKVDRLGDMVSAFQRCWRNYKKTKEAVKTRKETALFLYKQGKERRRESFYRPYSGLYLDLWKKDEELKALIQHHEKSDHMRPVFVDWISLISSNQALPMALQKEKFPALFSAWQGLSSTVNCTAWKREANILMVITKENIFLIQQQRGNGGASAAGAASPGRSQRSLANGNGSAKETPGRVVSPTGAEAQAASAAYVPTWFLRRVIPLPSLSSLTMTNLADTYLALRINKNHSTTVKSPAEWKADKDVSQCAECGDRFGLFTRKHHCRFWSAVQHLCSHGRIKCAHNLTIRGCVLCPACASSSGDIFCFACSQRTLLCPDYTLSLHTPQRCCSFCFGRENADYLQDILLSSDKKTEVSRCAQPSTS